jgi:hypothetical protein
MCHGFRRLPTLAGKLNLVFGKERSRATTLSMAMVSRRSVHEHWANDRRPEGNVPTGTGRPGRAISRATRPPYGRRSGGRGGVKCLLSPATGTQGS